MPFNLDIEHLLEVYPEDGMCPALKIKMVWGRGVNDDTPALDRKMPSRGYVLGNVAFISTKANRIKSNATNEEVLAVAKYLQG
jgi:hypothetical protein